MSASGVESRQIDLTGRPFDTLPQTDMNVPTDLANEPFDVTKYVPAHQPTVDLVHRFYQEQAQINDGAMGRFVAVSDAKGLCLAFYPTDDLPLVKKFRSTVFCAGCHGDVGATTDSMFAFARKLGYLRWSQRDRRDAGAAPEELRYLRKNRAGDDFRDNEELIAHLFDRSHELRPETLRKLGAALWPSPARALALDQAYRAIVVEQSFTRGRETRLAATRHAYSVAPVGAATGVTRPVR